MNDAENGSDIARLRRRIALEEEAAQRGLTGLAIVASHDFITARMERGAERILQLIEEGKHTEAVALMNTETWAIEEQGKPVEQETFIERSRSKHMKRSGYDGHLWIFENDSLLVRMEDKTYRKHLNAYLESEGIPTLTYLQLLEYVNQVLDKRYLVAQHLHNPEYWRECNDPDVQIVQLTRKVK